MDCVSNLQNILKLDETPNVHSDLKARVYDEVNNFQFHNYFCIRLLDHVYEYFRNYHHINQMESAVNNATFLLD